MNDTEKRAVYLMRIAASVIQHNAPEATAYYDEAECDGLCLADDLKIAADDLEHPF
jgi:hypothetical protein